MNGNYTSDLFHILHRCCHLLASCAPGIPAPLLYLLGTGTNLPFQVPGRSLGPCNSKVKIYIYNTIQVFKYYSLYRYNPKGYFLCFLVSVKIK